MDSKFRDFFFREYWYVVRFLMHCGAPLEFADAVARQAFAEAWQLAKRDDWADVPSKNAWIRTVAYKYLELPYSRWPRAMPVPDLPEGAQIGDIISALTSETGRVVEAIRSLPPEQRVVVAFTMDQIPEDIIAVHLDITNQEVQELHQAARRALARSLTGMTPPEEAIP